MKSLKSLKAGWEIEPYFGSQFVNIIATLNPKASKRLILSANYDLVTKKSDVMREFDGAVPCAMLLNAVTVLDELLTKTPFFLLGRTSV